VTGNNSGRLIQTVPTIAWEPGQPVEVKKCQFFRSIFVE